MILRTKVSVQRGFSFIELVVVMGVLLTLMGLGTITLINTQHKTNLNTVVDTFSADIKSQQIKAMTGDTGGGASPNAYGLHISSSNYTLFSGTTYNSGSPTNFTPSFPTTVQVSTTLPGSNAVFATGSGELVNVTVSKTVTFTDSGTSQQKTVTINRYGVITGVN